MVEQEFVISWNDGKGLRTLVVYESTPISTITHLLAKDAHKGDGSDIIFNGIEGVSITPVEHTYD
jgi:hypothetical protein